MRAQTAAILAATPGMYGALTSKDETQRELALQSFARKAGADFVAIIDGQGRIAGFMKLGAAWDRDTLDHLNAEWSDERAQDAVRYVDGKLCRMHRYALGSEGLDMRPPGAVIVGSEMGASCKRVECNVFCDIAFVYGDSTIASTLSPEKEGACRVSWPHCAEDHQSSQRLFHSERSRTARVWFRFPAHLHPPHL
jgi:hypothetical protein